MIRFNRSNARHKSLCPQLPTGILQSHLPTQMLILIAALLCGHTSLLSQTFSLTNVDISNYPTISATMNLLDENGVPLPNPDPAEFNVVDAGNPVPVSDIQVNCISESEPNGFCAVLALDHSPSMNTILRDPIAGTRLDMVRFAANEFIENIDESVYWSVALLSFSTDVKVLQRFSSNKAILQSDILGLQIQENGRTEMEPAFLKPGEGALPLIASGCKGPSASNRFIVLITDGGPTDDPDADKIIDVCKQLDVTVYAITIDFPIDDRLKRVCLETGGVAFEQVSDISVIRKLFDFFILREQNSQSCTITWKAPFDCDYPTDRRVNLSYQPLKLSTDIRYEIPEYGVPPQVNAGRDQIVCAGESITLQATGTAGEYSWEPADFLDDPNSPTPQFQSNSAVQEVEYSVTIKDANGCTATDKVKVSVGEPQVSVSADRPIICIGETVNLLAESNGGSLQWSPAAGLSNANTNNPSAAPTEDTWYYCRLSAGSCEALDSVLVRVSGKDLAIELADETSACYGETVFLQANVTGAQRLLWSGGAKYSRTDIANPEVETLESGWHYLLAVGENDCQVRDSIFITINDLPVVDAGPERAICLAAAVQLEAESTPGEYLWTPAAGLDDPTILNPMAQPDETTEYTLTVTSPAGCVASDVVTVRVNEAATLDVSADVDICFGESTQIVANGGSGEYLWTPADGLDDPSSANPRAEPLQTTTYRVTHTTPQGCVSQGRVVVTVHPNPTVEHSQDLETCRGVPVTLRASSAAPGARYTWSPITHLNRGDGQTVIATLNRSTRYTVRVEDENGCTVSSQLNVKVLPAEKLTFALQVNDAQHLLPRDQFELRINANSPDLEAGEVREFRLVVPYNAKVLRPVENSIVYSPDLGDWQITASYDGGQLVFEGSGPTPLREPELLRLQMEVFLPDSDDPTLAINFDDAESSIPSTCIRPEYEGTEISFSPLCLTVARDLFITGLSFGLSAPAPNPASHALEIAYVLAFDVHTQIEVFDMLGQRVQVLIDQRVPSGAYSSSFDISSLGSGNYTLRMQAGPFVKVHNLVVQH